MRKKWASGKAGKQEKTGRRAEVAEGNNGGWMGEKEVVCERFLIHSVFQNKPARLNPHTRR
jgi:hypothetical protein